MRFQQIERTHDGATDGPLAGHVPRICARCAYGRAPIGATSRCPVLSGGRTRSVKPAPEAGRPPVARFPRASCVAGSRSGALLHPGCDGRPDCPRCPALTADGRARTPFVDVTRQTIRLSPLAETWVGVEELADCHAGGGGGAGRWRPSLESPVESRRSENLERSEQTEALYRGRFTDS